MRRFGFSPIQTSVPSIPRQRGAAPAAALPRLLSEVRQTRRLRLRPARTADLPGLVEVDLRAFSQVYREYEHDAGTRRERLRAAFEQRLARLGAEWTPVLWDGDRIVGFLMSCRTNRAKEDFRTWEEMTDGGTLESTHDPDGRNVYIVTLSMVPGSSGPPGRSMLFANLIGTFIRHDIAEVFFESRLPGLRPWLARQCSREGRRIAELTDAERREHAERYLRLTRTVDGREVPYDQLLRVYDTAGARIVRLVENGYQDGPSLNFGALCVLPNPMPDWAQRQPVLRALAGRALTMASHSPLLMRKAF